MIIDAHVHLTSDGRWFQTPYDASVDTALQQMDRVGIKMASIIPMPGRNQRDFVANLVGSRSDRFFTGFTISALEEAEFQEFRTWIEGGLAKFAKVHPRETGIAPLEPKLGRFLDVAEKTRIPVIFDTYVRGSRLPLNELIPFRYDELARQRPKLTIILAHSGGHRVLDALAVAQTQPNVYLELSHVLAYFRETSLEKDFAFVMNRLDKKLIYGSDFPEYPIDSYLKMVQQMISALTDFDTKAFLGSTWKRLISKQDQSKKIA
jgi:predicted TIM-barrel fold metal-dependent hydrolase